MKLCTALRVEAIEGQVITSATVLSVSMVPDDHAHPHTTDEPVQVNTVVHVLSEALQVRRS